MLRRLSIAEFLGLLIDHISDRTGVPCYDSPDNRESPLCSVEIVRTEPADTKTAFVERYQVWVHCISAPAVGAYSNAPVLGLVQAVEEALTEDVALPAPYLLYGQAYDGLQTLKMDESREGHAVLSYEFHVCYGYRCK